MSIVITVENLGKKYTLYHQKREQYTALRDVITNSVKSLGKKYFSPVTSHQSPVTDSEDFWALKDVSFEVNQGDRIGIIGRNGAGKSTLLKILSRITEPTTGSIRIKGRVASLLEVGTGFHPELTGRENIFLNGAILGMSRVEIRKKFDEIVDFAEIEKFLDTPVKRYSSGMYVRLAFAVAAHLEPEILIVDEVLAVGDAQFQKKCLGKMEDVSAREGRTILFVSHNLASVAQLCNLGICLEASKIKHYGSINRVVENYMDSGVEHKGLREWGDTGHQPGNDRIRLVAIRTQNVSGEITSSFEMQDAITVEIEYEILKPQTGMRTGFWVFTIEGILIFVAGDSEDRSWNGVKRNSGRYLSSCIIPGMFLNSGSYSISVAADIKGSEMLFIEHQALDFQVEHTGVTTLDGAARSPGIICPSLKWQITSIVNK